MKADSVNIHPSWKEVLKGEFESDYFSEIKNFLLREKKAGKKIYPPGPLIFNAFDSTPFKKVKVVILGQDPYHGPGQAIGLSFSVPKGVKPPPSLINVFKEIESDLGIAPPDHGDLSHWASQGVFLLNAILTVEHKKAGSHRKMGWEKFTDAVIKTLSDRREQLVFLLWGNFAKTKIPLIDQMKHYVLDSPHPSPLARGGFFNNHHFSKTNELLIQSGKKPINWTVH
nr:uracil-DNA glycosylase [Saprospiraceae bacterium]